MAAHSDTWYDNINVDLNEIIISNKLTAKWQNYKNFILEITYMHSLTTG